MVTNKMRMITAHNAIVAAYRMQGIQPVAVFGSHFMYNAMPDKRVQGPVKRYLVQAAATGFAKNVTM